MASVPEVADAVSDALAAHLLAGLTAIGGFTGLDVLGHWPDAEYQMGEHVVAVAGCDIAETQYHAPQASRWTLDPGGLTGVVRYTYGRAELSLTLDVWGRSKRARRQLLIGVESLVNLHPVFTLGTAGVLTTRLRRAPGVVLRCPAFYDSIADCRFDATGATTTDGPDAASRAEWRGTWTGRATLYLMTEQAAATLRSLTVRTTLNGGAAESTVLTP